MSTVEVIIPCYNYGRFLKDCVDSVLLQKDADVKVLIIDDCSSDSTLEICHELAAADKRVSFIHHLTNEGHIATFNQGLAQAKSDYVVLISADDLLAPGALRRAVELMDKHPSVGMVYGRLTTFREDVPSVFRTTAAGTTIWKGADWLELMCRSGRNFIRSPEVVMRTSVQRRLGGHASDLSHSSDMEMWLRAAAISDIAFIQGVDQAYYRMHPLQLTQTVHAGPLFDLNQRRAAFESAFRKEAGQLPNAGQLLVAAKQALARTALRHVERSIKCGTELDEPISAYERFSRSTDPKVTETDEWRSFEHALRQRWRQQTRGRWLQIWWARRVAAWRWRIEFGRWRRSGVHHSIQ